MKTLYLECNMGASGDMLMGALLQLLPDPEVFLQRMSAMFGSAGVEVTLGEGEQCGIKGAHVTVKIHGEEEESQDVLIGGHTHDHDHTHHHHDHDHDHSHTYAQDHAHDHDHDHDHAHDHAHDHVHHHHHTNLHTIRHLLQHLPVSETVRQRAEGVYLAIAEAESHAHGKPVEKIHFHEVGAMDAVADIVGVCLLMEWLSPQQVVVSPVHVGSGHVKCAHGILPVPAPATAYLLQGIPSYSGDIRGELCTPTGAALLKTFATSFGPMPVMQTEKIGYGMGTKVFPVANCLRAFIGETQGAANAIVPASEKAPQIIELKCNLDDMTPEAIGYAQERLWESGAVDVFTAPIFMKKNRPGVLLTCLCKPETEDNVMQAMFRYTTTLGIRKTLCERYELHREIRQQEIKQGIVRIKTAEGYGVERTKPEYEDVAKIAKEQQCGYFEVEL